MLRVPIGIRKQEAKMIFQRRPLFEFINQRVRAAGLDCNGRFKADRLACADSRPLGLQPSPLRAHKSVHGTGHLMHEKGCGNNAL